MRIEQMSVSKTDILIIGAGGAGLRAALAALETNRELRVMVMSHGDPTSDGLTATACSDRMAFHVAFEHTPPGGDLAKKKHAEDIFFGGGMVSDPNIAILEALKAKGAFEFLEKLRVPWARDSIGNTIQFRTDGSEYPRACYTGPYTANHIHSVLLKEASRKGVKFLDDHQLLTFQKSKGEGMNWRILARTKTLNETAVITANSLILATGGPGALFGSPLYPNRSDAIPFFSALLAGAKLVNLEFIQYGLVSPQTRMACSGSMLRALPRVVNHEGEEILDEMELPDGCESPLELLFLKGASWPVSAESKALPVDIKIREAVARDEEVYLDFRFNPYGLTEETHKKILAKCWKGGRRLEYAATPLERLEKDNPDVAKWFKTRGIDLHHFPVEIRHEAQHFLGGILINKSADTGVSGLYACGECAGGPHGANRPGGNSLMDCQVMGAIAGANAARYSTIDARQHASGTIPQDRLEQIIRDGRNLSGYNLLEASLMVGNALKNAMGAVRNRKSFTEALNKLTQLHKKGIQYEEKNWHQGNFAIANITIAKAFLTSAKMRYESRGSHIISDSPGGAIVPRDSAYDHFWHVVHLDERNELQVKKEKVPEYTRDA